MKKLFVFLVVLMAFGFLFVYLFMRKLPTPRIPIESEEVVEKDISVKIVIGGDVMLGRSVYGKLKSDGFRYPFEKLSDFLNQADLVYVNLENPIIRDCPSHNSGYKFCSGYEAVDSLKYAGIDIMNLANNHTSNYGQAGIDETVTVLDSSGIMYTGFGNLAIKQINDLSIGFLGFDFTSQQPDSSDYNLIIDSAEKSDFLIVGVHWGVEYTNSPTDYQRQWAKKIAESGADVIVGHHPHWIQESEQVQVQAQEKTKIVPVFYSLGNLVFDQMWSEETRRGLLVELLISKDLIGNWKLLAPRSLLNLHSLSDGGGEGGEVGNSFETYIQNLGQPIILQDLK